MNPLKLLPAVMVLLPLAVADAQSVPAPLGTRSAAPGRAADGGADKLELLFKLAGKWKIEEEYPASEGLPQGATGKGEAVLKQALEGTALIGDYRSRSKTMDTDVSAHAVWTYDAANDQYAYFWFDNYGHAYRFIGQYQGRDKSFVFSRAESSDATSGTMSERHTYRIEDDDHLVFTMEFQTGPNAYELALTTHYTRKGAGQKKDLDDSESGEDEPRPKRSRGMLGR